MRKYSIAFLAVLAFGCSDAQQARTDDENRLDAATPAASTIHPAEATGYMDATDPQAFPPSPGVHSGEPMY